MIINEIELASDLATMALKDEFGEDNLYEEKENGDIGFTDEMQDYFNNKYDYYLWLIESKQEENQVQSAKDLLKSKGYFTDNLWRVDDVRGEVPDVSDEDTQEILRKALTNEATMDQVWFSINEFKSE